MHMFELNLDKVLSNLHAVLEKVNEVTLRMKHVQELEHEVSGKPSKEDIKLVEFPSIPQSIEFLINNVNVWFVDVDKSRENVLRVWFGRGKVKVRFYAPYRELIFDVFDEEEKVTYTYYLRECVREYLDKANFVKSMLFLALNKDLVVKVLDMLSEKLRDIAKQLELILEINNVIVRYLETLKK